MRGVDDKRSRGGGALLLGAEDSSFRGFDTVHPHLFIHTHPTAGEGEKNI